VVVDVFESRGSRPFQPSHGIDPPRGRHHAATGLLPGPHGYGSNSPMTIEAPRPVCRPANHLWQSAT
jgi:hypothetical protein